MYSESFQYSPASFEVNLGGDTFVVIPDPVANLDALGATAVSRCAPTNPNAGLATMLGELHGDGLPTATSSLLTSHNKGYINRAAADNLKLQFETLPFIGDIKDLHKSLTQHSRILRQYVRDSTRKVRRRYVFPSEDTQVALSTGGQPYPSAPYAFASYGSTSALRFTTNERWFAGQFSYVPIGLNTSKWNVLFDKYRKLNKLVGSSVGVSTVWNLTPWSWAVDWFTNTGDVLNNIQMMMNDGLIMEYGYVMETNTVRNVYTRTGARLNNGFSGGTYGLPSVWSASSERILKHRRQANPFGFGITYDGLNFRQMSILASLGLTRDARVP